MISKQGGIRRPGRSARSPRFDALEERQLLSGAWGSYAQNPQHTAISPTASQALDTIRWSAPVDLNPQYSGNDLLIHYGSPLITSAGTVIVPVKTGASGGFEVQGRSSTDGSLLWTQTTDYILPPHGWTPSFSPALTPGNRLYFAGAGGTIDYINSPDSPGATTSGQLAFYGIANYTHSGYDNSVYISTPITTDAAGDIYFGFRVTGANPSNLSSGIARIDAQGNGTWIAASQAANDTGITQVVMNCAPALSNDGKTLYISVSAGNFQRGDLVALNSTTLAPVAKVALIDPATLNNAVLPDDGTASPTVGPDGDVYIGVLENPFASNHDRGWLLHFSGDLATSKVPGAFGWDDTASIVPASMVPSYTGTSTYLVMTKYNNYAGEGGDGVNKVAVLDPTAMSRDPVTGASVMNVVLSIAGPTPDQQYIATHPNAVREWCINTAAVDPATKSILVNSEDGTLYRWDLTTNTFTQKVALTSGIGEAYTPTVIGVDGTVYAISNATLYAVGSVAGLPAPSNLSVTATSAPGTLRLSWSAVPGATDYLVERSPNGTSGWTQITDVAATNGVATLTTDNTGLAASTTYSYRLRTVAGSADSPYGATVAGTTSTAAVSPPLSSDSFDATKLSRAWKAVHGTWKEAGGVVRQTSTAAGDPKKLEAVGQSYPADVRIIAKVRVDSWAGGNFARVGVGLYTDPTTGNGYNLVFHNDTHTVQFLDDHVRWGNRYTFNWTPGAWYWFALEEQGGKLFGKVWADGTDEPSGWMFEQDGWVDRTGGAPALNGGSLAGATASFDEVRIDAAVGPAVLGAVAPRRDGVAWSQANAVVAAPPLILADGLDATATPGKTARGVVHPAGTAASVPKTLDIN